MFIDIHTHCYRKRVPFVVNFCTIDELLERNEQLGIEKCVIQPIVSPEIYFPQTNEDILDMAEAYPDKVIPFCIVDPRALTNSPYSKLDDVLKYYKDRGCKGVGEVMPNLELQDPLVQNLFACAEKVDLPITYDGSDVRTGDFGLYDDPGLPQLEHTLQRFPDLKIFGHGPVFWYELGKLDRVGSRGYVFKHGGSLEQVGRPPKCKIVEEGAVPRLMREYPNLLGDLSDGTPFGSFSRDEDYAVKFVTEFQDRLFFGTDMCFKDMNVPMPGLLMKWRDEGKITQEIFYKIAKGNAEKLLGLK